MTKHITGASFDLFVSKSTSAAIYFWASWCEPCKIVGPIVDELSEEFGGSINVGKVDVGHNKDLASKWLVTSLPTILFFKHGKIINSIAGSVTKDVLRKKMKAMSRPE